MADVVIRPTEPGDADLLYANLRGADLEECLAYGLPDVQRAIHSSVGQSLLCWSGFVDGELAAIIGVTPVSVLGGVGSPWMLGTPVLDANARILVRLTPRYISRMLTTFPHLVNYVYARNTTSLRWLRRLGFAIGSPKPFGALGMPFCPFEMKA